MKKIILISLALFGFAGTAIWLNAEELEKVAHFPKEIKNDCKNGRAFVFDECGSQVEYIKPAMEAAEASGKVVIVSYGAEWCIWCHVLDNYLRGKSGKFRYKLEDDEYFLNELAGAKERDEARALNQFASENFVLLHIESKYSPDGYQALQIMSAVENYNGHLPYVFSLNKDGKFAAAMPATSEVPGLQVRETALDWYRGYNREILTKELKKLITKAKE